MDTENMSGSEPTQDLLRYLFRYDENTGEFFHRNPQSNRVRAGSVAGARQAVGYTIIGVLGVRHYAHRLAIIYAGGEIGGNHVIDHINQDKSDNRLENLRVVDRKINARNKRRTDHQQNETCGVYLSKRDNKWKAELGSLRAGTYVYIGSFSSYENARAARLAAQARHGYTEIHGTWS